MSTYAANPAAIGVGKTYGPAYVGGVVGGTVCKDGKLDLVARLNAGELSRPLKVWLPPFTKVESLQTIVKVALAGGYKVKVGASGTALTTAVDCSTPGVGAVDATLTGFSPRATVATGEYLYIVPESGAVSAATGHVDVIIRCTRV